LIFTLSPILPQPLPSRLWVEKIEIKFYLIQNLVEINRAKKKKKKRTAGKGIPNVFLPFARERR